MRAQNVCRILRATFGTPGPFRYMSNLPSLHITPDPMQCGDTPASLLTRRPETTYETYIACYTQHSEVGNLATNAGSQAGWHHRSMMTQQLEVSILAAPLAAIDRRALSQAWYSALHLAGPDQQGRPFLRPHGAKRTLAAPVKAAPKRDAQSPPASHIFSGRLRKNEALQRSVQTKASKDNGATKPARKYPADRDMPCR